MSRKTGIIVGVVSLVTLFALVMYGPALEKSTPDQIFWKKEFDKIEYMPAGKERNVLTRFIRKPGFSRDEFTSEAPGKFAVRRGNYNVKNIFTDFGRPRNAGQYKVKPESLPEYGLTDVSAEVLLYESQSGKPIRLRVGKKNQNGNTFTLCDDPKYKDQLLLIPTYLFERFERPLKEFRETRLVIFPSDSYTEFVSANVKTGGQERSYSMTQTKYKKEGVELPRWLDKDGKEIPINYGSPFENSVRDIQIQEFRDTEGLPNADQAWKEAGSDTTEAHIKIKGMDETVIRLRSQKPITFGKDVLIPMQVSTESGTDFVKLSVEKEINDRMIAVVEGMEQKARQDKLDQMKPKEPHPQAKP